jgi:hypothetical protein
VILWLFPAHTWRRVDRRPIDDEHARSVLLAAYSRLRDEILADARLAELRPLARRVIERSLERLRRQLEAEVGPFSGRSSSPGSAATS